MVVVRVVVVGGWICVVGYVIAGYVTVGYVIVGNVIVGYVAWRK